MDFAVKMVWQNNLSTNTLTYYEQSFPIMDVRAILDDTPTGSIVFSNPPPTTIRVTFRGGPIISPLSSLVNLGYDSSTLPTVFTSVSVQSPNATNTTWITIDHQQSRGVEEWIEFNEAPVLTDPVTFGSADLLSLLTSEIGQQYSYREDGNGLQNMGNATLRGVSYDSASIVSEPSYGFVIFDVLCLFALARSNPVPKARKVGALAGAYIKETFGSTTAGPTGCSPLLL